MQLTGWAMTPQDQFFVVSAAAPNCNDVTNIGFNITRTQYSPTQVTVDITSAVSGYFMLCILYSGAIGPVSGGGQTPFAVQANLVSITPTVLPYGVATTLTINGFGLFVSKVSNVVVKPMFVGDLRRCQDATDQTDSYTQLMSDIYFSPDGTSMVLTVLGETLQALNLCVQMDPSQTIAIMPNSQFNFAGFFCPLRFQYHPTQLINWFFLQVFLPLSRII